jgi:hypothetical protein
MSLRPFQNEMRNQQHPCMAPFGGLLAAPGATA